MRKKFEKIKKQIIASLMQLSFQILSLMQERKYRKLEERFKKDWEKMLTNLSSEK